MKDVLLPISAPTLVSAAVGRFGIKVNIFQSDTDSDSSYPNPEFIVATSINREDLGTTLRIGDKLAYVNGRPTYEMWNVRLDQGVIRLSFEEKRKKRKPKCHDTIPKVICGITGMAEKSEYLYLRPETERSQKLLRSSGAIATISNVLHKMDTLEKDKISNNSSNVSSNEDESSSIVTTVQFKDQTLYCCAKIREKHFLYLWVSSQHFTKTDCTVLTTQMTSMLDFLNGNEFFDDDDTKILDDFVDQLNADSKSTNFTVPGTVQWRHALRDYSHTLPVDLSADIDSALAEIDAIEFDSIVQTPNQFYPRRKYFVIGSAVYYRGLLIGSHSSREDQKLLSTIQSAKILMENETFCHEVFPSSRLIQGQIVGYERPENASYCVIMVNFGPSDASVTVVALLETFVPIERGSPPNIDPMMVRRCRQVAKVLSKNEKLRIWYETPEFLISDDRSGLSSRRSAFSRNPFSRNRNDIETGSHQSGSTTASFIAPVNVGEQFQNVQNELVDVTTKNAGLEFYSCFIENGVILLPRTNHQFPRSDLIRKVQEQIAILKPQLQTEQEVGVLVSDGHRKGSCNMYYWVIGRCHEDRELFVCFEEKIPQNMNEIILKFGFGLLTKA